MMNLKSALKGTAYACVVTSFVAFVLGVTAFVWGDMISFAVDSCAFVILAILAKINYDTYNQL